jgi:hypothetical protein
MRYHINIAEEREMRKLCIQPKKLAGKLKKWRPSKKDRKEKRKRAAAGVSASPSARRSVEEMTVCGEKNGVWR